MRKMNRQNNYTYWFALFKVMLKLLNLMEGFIPIHEEVSQAQFLNTILAETLCIEAEEIPNCLFVV